MLPTPASSTEIKGQDGAKQLPSLQMSFELPPSAMDGESSPKASFRMQPSETVKSRRRSSTTTAAAAATATATATHKETFALPPPPTRSRKIIQMKPRGQEKAPAPAPAPLPPSTTSAKTPASNNTQSAPSKSVGTGSGSGSKRKQPSTTSAAGRKIARKTAHSLIERRRRSKMNEEFAVLKGLIPACTGEMHKLAILQVKLSRPVRQKSIKLISSHARW